ncbi:MAG: carbonic anhydrase family protein [Phycisphaerales bacterium JB040]
MPRTRVSALALAAAAALLTGCASSERTDVLTADTLQNLTPQEALQRLKDGNRRFVSDNLTPVDYLAQKRATAGGQYPKAVILGCIDSRVPAEIIFDLGVGDAFVARVAGNFENTDILGSMEFATAVAGSKVIVVLGHTACGAVKGAADGVELGNLTSMLANIDPAIAASQGVPGEKSSKNEAYVNAIIRANVVQTVADIEARSPVMAERIASGDLLVVGGVYDLTTGRVEWLDG